MSIKYVENQADFENIIDQNQYVLVEFFATWCPHCQAFEPVLSEASDQLANEGVIVAQCDVDRLQQLASDFNVEATPTLFFINNKKVVLEHEGEMSMEEVISFANQGKTLSLCPYQEITNFFDEASLF